MPSYQDAQRALDLRERSVQNREDAAASAQDLHERMFGEAQAKNTHEMGIQDLHAEYDRAALIEKLVTERAALADSIHKKISAAALVEKLSGLDPTHKDYEVQAAKAAYQYSDGAGSDAVKMVAAMQKDTRDRYLNTQNELFKAGTARRIEKISDSESVPPALKSAINDPSGQGFDPALGFNPTALDAAESAMQKGGGKNYQSGADAFYKNVAQKTALSANDLSTIDSQPPGTTKYQDASGNFLSSDQAAGKEGVSAVNGEGPVPFKIPLQTFNWMMQNHRNFQAGGAANAAASTAAAGLGTTQPAAPAPTAPAPTPVATPPPVAAAATPAATGSTDAKTVLAQYLGSDGQFSP